MSNTFKVEEISNPAEKIRSFFNLMPYEPDCIKWLEENISFEDDVSSESSRLNFAKYHYQIAPIRYACQLDGRRECTFVMMEQRRKDECNVHGNAL